jgi:hypothetical protein
MNRIEECFALLEQAAIAGARCPQSAPFGPVRSGDVTALCRDGKILVEVFVHNWRVVTILTGPHAGKKTETPPTFNHSPKPYKTVGRETRVNGRIQESYSTRSKRIGPSAPRAIHGLRDLKEGGR